MIDAKRYLQQIKDADDDIEDLLDERAQLKARLTKVTSTLSDVSVSGTKNNDKMGDAIAKLIIVEDVLNCKIDKLIDLKKEVCAVIDKVSNENQRKVLKKRYVLFKRWEQIACEMYMTYRNVCYIHGRALQAVQRILEDGDGDA